MYIYSFKRILSAFIAILIICTQICLPVYAQNDIGPYSWYCVHAKDHRRPSLDASMRWITEAAYDGYYIDPARTDDAAEGERVLYLTFDVGYENGNVEKILDVLKQKEVTGSFFILAHVLEKNTPLVMRMFEEGHTVCNHTAHHPDMSKITDKARFSQELTALETLCLEKTGRPMAKLYRPPEGRFSRQNLAWAKELGYRTIFWSFGYADWDNARQPSPESALKKVMDNIHNGAIILLHPTSATNAAILGEVIDQCHAMGYRFASLEALPTSPTLQ